MRPSSIGVAWMMAVMFFVAGLSSDRSARAQSPEGRSAVIEKAREELAAAERQLRVVVADTEQARAQLSAAQRKLLAEEAWAARQAAEEAQKAESDARSSVTSKATQLKSAQEKLAAARKSAEKAAAEKATAAKTLESAAADKKAEREKSVQEKTASAAQAEEAVVAGQRVVERANLDKKAAEQILAETEAKHRAALV